MNKQSIPLRPNPNDEDDLNYLPIIKTIWKNRKTLIITITIGSVMGFIFAIMSPKEYTVSTVMVPQLGNTSQSKLAGLGGLAALAGINIDMNQGNDLSPMVYPQIISSIPFQLELMNTPLNFEDYKTPITFFDYYNKYSKTSISGILHKYTIGLPRTIINAIKGKPKDLILPKDTSIQPILLTYDQFLVKEILDDLVTLDLNVKQGYITLTIIMPEALAAAQLAIKAQKLMQSEIIAFKIQKVKSDLEFIEGRCNEAKAEFEKAQVSLALVNDRNKNFMSGVPQIESDRIQTKFTIAFSVFQDLAKQVEQAKIQVKKETPIFTIIQPVTIPSEKSKPNRPVILFTWIFLGGFAGIVIVFGKKQFNSLKIKWNAEDV